MVQRTQVTEWPPKANPKIIVCIPAFNEEKSIGSVVVRALRLVDGVVVCDDGSSDATAETAEDAGARVIRHERNQGYGAALCDLLIEATRLDADTVITMDADGQHDPRFLPFLVDPILDGSADIVIGSRFLGGPEAVPSYRKAGVKFLTAASNQLTDLNLTDCQSGYRAYSAEALPKIIPAEFGMGASTEILARASEAGLRIKEVPITVEYDVGRSSTQNPFSHGLGVLLSTVKYYSIRHPLMTYGIPGLAALVVAFSFGFWALEIFRQTRFVSTNMVLVSIGAGIFGLVLVVTGVILYTLVSVVRDAKRGDR
jgi:glycosyltransferase involved in cell wall biosynthesis